MSYNRAPNFNNLDLVLPFMDYWDYELNSDPNIPEYIYSNTIIDNGLIFNFDFNSQNTSVKITDGLIQYVETPTFSSKQYASGFTLTDIGLNSINISSGTDGDIIGIGQNPEDYPVLGEYTSTTLSYTGETLTFVSGDTNLKLWRVFPYGTRDYDFPLQSSTDSSGNFIEFGGGYFNGFYKLFGYPHQLIQKRFNKGWTFQLNVNTRPKPELFTSFTGITLNDTFTGNTGFILYLGVRQENKFWDSFTGITSNPSGVSISLLSSEIGTSTGVSLDPYEEVKNNSKITNNMLAPGNLDPTIDSGLYYNWGYNPVIWSGITDNVLGFRITPDFRLGYRKITTKTTYIYTSTTESNMISGVMLSGCTTIVEPIIVEEYAPTPMFQGYICGECDPNTLSTWVNLTIKWERDFEYTTDCELEYGKHKSGKLSTYVNGRPYWSITGFTEFIPYELPTDPTKQEGVPFTISLGGGSSGLFQSQISTLKETPMVWENMNIDWDSLVEFWNSNNYKQITKQDLFLGKYQGGIDPTLLIQQYFAGTYLGGISSFKMYEKPLNISEIRHNYNSEKCRYNFKGNFGGRLIILPKNECEVLNC